MFEIFISKLIDKDILLDIEAFIQHKLLSIDKTIVVKVLAGKDKAVLYKFDDQGRVLSQDLLKIIELAKELLIVKIVSRNCYHKFKVECINCGVSFEQ